MSVSTLQCKTFLAEFFGRNIHIIEALLGQPLDAETLTKITNPNNWKRRYKSKADTFSSYMIFPDGCVVNRYAETNIKAKGCEFVHERGFDCDPFDGTVAYVVLEKSDSTLVIGPYIGD